MKEKIMTLMEAPVQGLPPQLIKFKKDLDALGKNSQVKFWKQVVITFSRLPTGIELTGYKRFVKALYRKGAKEFQKLTRAENKDPQIRIKVIFTPWIVANTLKYFISMKIEDGGPGNTNLIPPANPKPPPSPL
ncbi:MAG TPA: hypothetical protein VK588_08325 [Chitinophagaceae bacterium]|nr:hypothetical protein [Chitinophagaceae bacterium]